MLDRRQFLLSAGGLALSTGPGRLSIPFISSMKITTAATPEQVEYEAMLARSPGLKSLGLPRDGSCIRDGLHPFSPERIMLFTRQMLQDSASQNRSARERIRRQTEQWRHGFQPALDMPPEKFDLLVTLTDHMANHYHRPDRAEEWAARLVCREAMAASYLGPGCGLIHQFQGRINRPIRTTNGAVDWWLFMFPGGTDFDSPDGQLTHALIGHVFDHRGVRSELDVWCLTAQLARTLQPDVVWRKMALEDQGTVARCLNYRLAYCLEER